MYNNGNSSKNVTGASVVDGTLENADYADNGLSADKIDGGTLSNVNVDDTTAANIIAQVDDNEISGDKIDAGIISNFQSTGIDDRLPTGKILTLDTTGGTVTGNLIVEKSQEAKVTINSTTTGVGGGVVLGSLEFESQDSNGPGLQAKIDAFTENTVGSTAMRFFSSYAFGATPAEAMRIDSIGKLYSVPTYNNTSAISANMVVDYTGVFKRFTSSAKYKTDIETIEDSYADAILGLRPVWYKSTCEGDNQEWGYWGFIAEEVAEIDPRLVFWKTEEMTDEVNEETGERITIPLETPEAEGVQYDRVIPHLVNLLQRQTAQLESLTTRIETLESA
jgi:hypothetical protein